MNVPPPVVGGPPPQPRWDGLTPPVERRQSWAWVVMSLLFAGLIGLSLMSYFGVGEDETDPGDATGRFAKEEGELNYWVAVKTIAPAFDSKDSTGSRGQIRAIADRVRPSVQKDKEAARLYAVATFEAGELPKEPLDVLIRSEDAGDQALALIYLDTTPTAEEAQVRSEQLEDHGFVTTLAKVHARERLGDREARTRLLPVGKWLAIAALVAGIFLVALAGLCLWLGYAVARAQNKLMPRGFPLPCVTLLDGDRGAARIVQFLLIFVFVGLVAGLATVDLDEATQGAALSTAIAIVFFTSLGLPVFGRKTSFRQVLGETRGIGKLIGWGLLGWMAMVPLVLVLSFASQALSRFLPEPTHPISDMLPNAGPWQAAMLFLAAAILAPLLEETAFRGILLPAVSRAVGSVLLGILISSFLFASIHPQGIAGWPPLMGIGAVCAVLTYQTRSLIPAIVLHAVHNGLIVAVSLLLL